MTETRAKSVGYKSKLELIEAQARYLQLEIWNRRFELWDRSVPHDPVELLEPGIALKHRGYAIETVSSLGVFNEDGVTSEAAGMLDHKRRSVSISARFPDAVRRFTAAHELGHVVLHPDSQSNFRDLPHEGPTFRRSFREREADYFAVFFLMPARQVLLHFRERFRCTRFVLNDDTAFALGGKSLDSVCRACPTRRDLSSMLAAANCFDGRHIRPMTEVFGVSRSAMAIRLEELGLV